MKNVLLMLNLVFLVGCASSLPRLETVERVNLERFMGEWYVIAHIPVFIEKNAFNAVEEYELLDDGSIDTFFTFNEGSFDGPVKRYNPRGFVVDQVNHSTWKMQFIWPFKAEYLITHLNQDYTQTVIGRNKRDYVWIMARTPTISQADYQQIVDELSAQGYDISKLRKVPQSQSR
ncbi:MAG: lipocalin family protein [Candidatus Omnitrophica bacterium]|nr:lipocalin family protein [Candidatus Omnitrophota bacterium]